MTIKMCETYTPSMFIMAKEGNEFVVYKRVDKTRKVGFLPYYSVNYVKMFSLEKNEYTKDVLLAAESSGYVVTNDKTTDSIIHIKPVYAYRLCIMSMLYTDSEAQIVSERIMLLSKKELKKLLTTYKQYPHPDSRAVSAVATIIRLGYDCSCIL